MVQHAWRYGLDSPKGKKASLLYDGLVSSTGKKMGKTESGAIWLRSREMTSPYDLFQYFRNMEDDMVETCLFYFSDLPVEEVKRLGALGG